MDSYIVKAFVKGIFKTSGSLFVLGVGLLIYNKVKKEDIFIKIKTEDQATYMEDQVCNHECAEDQETDNQINLEYKKLFIF